jgi:hypothetical protein
MRLPNDGAPSHVSGAVTEFLNENFEGRWVGTGGPVAWPTWSPNLNTKDFFVWACMKWRVHHGGKTEARHLLVEAIDEATIGMRN